MVEEEWIDPVDSHVTKWRKSSAEYQRISERKILGSIEIDTEVAEFASKLQGIMPFDITGVDNNA